MKKYTIYYGSMYHEIPWDDDARGDYDDLQQAVADLEKISNPDVDADCGGYVYNNETGVRVYTTEVGYIRNEEDWVKVRAIDFKFGWE